MNQTSALFAIVAFAFLFFVTTRGDLPKWLGMLGLAPTSPGGTGTAGAAGGTGLTVPTPPTAPSVPWNGTSLGRTGVTPDQANAPGQAIGGALTRWLFPWAR